MLPCPRETFPRTRSWLLSRHHRRRQRVETQLAPAPAHRPAIDLSLAGLNALARPYEDEAARWHPSRRDLESHATVFSLDRIAEGPMRRPQFLDEPALRAEPLGRDPGGDHERSISLALVGEEIEHRPNEVRCNPAMRHVSDEARQSRVSSDDLGPLVPGRRAPPG